MPEAMDLFIAGIENRPGVLYQSTASMAPRPTPRTFAQSLGGAWSAVSGILFDFLYEITSRYDPRYPCAAPDCGKDNERVLVEAMGHTPDLRANDGAVPIRSQIWGTLVWAGYGDHLDVLGHYGGNKGPAAHAAAGGAPAHVDWLCSGSKFDDARFGALVDAAVVDPTATTTARRIPVVARAWLVPTAAATWVTRTEPIVAAPKVIVHKAAVTRPRRASGVSSWRTEIAGTARSVRPVAQHMAPTIAAPAWPSAPATPSPNA
jgi:hypothetical protein